MADSPLIPALDDLFVGAEGLATFAMRAQGRVVPTLLATLAHARGYEWLGARSVRRALREKSFLWECVLAAEWPSFRYEFRTHHR